MLIGCTNSSKTSLAKRIQELETENNLLKKKLEVLEHNYVSPLDSALNHSAGCYLPQIILDAKRKIYLGDTFMATVHLSKTKHQSNIKMLLGNDSSIKQEYLKYNQESVTYTCVPNSTGQKTFCGDYVIQSGNQFSHYPFELNYEVIQPSIND